MQARKNRLSGRCLLGAAAVAMACAAGGALAQGVAGAEASSIDFLKAMFRMNIAEEVSTESRAIAESCDEATAAEIAEASDGFMADTAASIRTGLESRFGDSARGEFGAFVDAFVKAEADGDAVFLKSLVEDGASWAQAVTNYPGLRDAAAQGLLRDDLAAAGKFLADVQTWVDLKAKGRDVPVLRAWLDRAKAAKVGKAKKTVKKNSLRDSEATAAAFEEEEDAPSGALAGFGAAREERRRKAMDEAKAGMQQVAEERRAAEEEFAAKKTSAAQAEAEAVRKQAEKLAAAESEAIEQRKNSWSGRLKSILSTTIGATSGAFLGSVGGRAGEAAANAIFNEEGSGGHHGRGGEDRE